MIMMGLELLLCFLLNLFFGSLPMQLVSGCNFPTYMQSNNTGRDWRSSIKNQNTEFTLNIQVVGNKIRTVATDNTATSHTRVCLQSLQNDKYLVAHEQSGQDSNRYTCIQFLKRSNTVVQIKEAPLSTSMGKNLCQNSNLELNDWIIIDESTVHEDMHTCPLTGGFSIQVFDNSMREGVCDSGYSGQTRIESECAMEHGIHFYFRNQKCVPKNLLMYATQQTICLANWQEGPYTFILLRHNHEEFKQYMWIMRYPTSQGGSFIALILMDLVADMHAHVAKSNNYLRLDVVRDTPRPAHSLCLDDYEMCEHYSSPCSTPQLRLTCPRTCKVCDETKPTLCMFPQKYQAQWYNAANPGTLAVSVNNTFIKTYNGQEQETLHCIQWDAEEPSQNRYLHKQMLVNDFDNGCRPRYSCVEFMQQTTSVLFLKLSQELTWPFSATPEEPLDCRHFSFDDDSSPTANLFKTKYLNLVYLRASNSVPCDLPTDITNYTVEFNRNQTRCTASLVVIGKDKKAFNLVTSNACPMRTIETHYTCVDSSRMLPRRDQLVVTRSLSNPDLIHCWVFPKRQNDLFYLLSAKDCNEAARKRLNRDRLKYIAVFSRSGVFPSPGNNGADGEGTLITEETIVVTPRVKTPSHPPNDKSSDSTEKTLNDDHRVLDNDTVPTDNKTTVKGTDNDLKVTATSAIVVGVVLTFAIIQTFCICKS